MVGGVAITYLCGTGSRGARDLDFVAGPKDRARSGRRWPRRDSRPTGSSTISTATSGSTSRLRRTAGRRLHGPDGHVPHARPARPAPALQPDRAGGRSRPEQASDRRVHREGPADTQTLLEHLEIAERHDAIDPRRIQEVTSADWGWYHTVSRTSSGSAVPGMSSAERAGELLGLINEWPKTRRWTRRARVGTRKQWYRLPEEVAHGSPAGGA